MALDPCLRQGLISVISLSKFRKTHPGESSANLELYGLSENRLPKKNWCFEKPVILPVKTMATAGDTVITVYKKCSDPKKMLVITYAMIFALSPCPKKSRLFHQQIGGFLSHEGSPVITMVVSILSHGHP